MPERLTARHQNFVKNFGDASANTNVTEAEVIEAKTVKAKTVEAQATTAKNTNNLYAIYTQNEPAYASWLFHINGKQP